MSLVESEAAVVDSLTGAESTSPVANVPTYDWVFEPRPGWRLVDWRELYQYRDLFWFLTWRSIKTRYAQTVIGLGWAVIQPLFSMLVFTIVFGKLAGIESDGVPYAAFSFAALVPWTFFVNALTDSANSLVSNTSLLTKVYIPRFILPLSAVTAKLLDFGIAMLLLFAIMVFFGIAPTVNVLFLPLLILLMIVAATGTGAWLTALSIQFRDVKHATTFVAQLLMYAAPVVYPTTLVPPQYRLVYAINPMVGVIEGFRASLLGTRDMPWDLIGMGCISATVLLVSGMMYFRSRERLFADVA